MKFFYEAIGRIVVIVFVMQFIIFLTGIMEYKYRIVNITKSQEFIVHLNHNNTNTIVSVKTNQ